MKDDRASIFNNLLDTFENEDIKKFAENCIDTLPKYFYEVGASSTGKWHPAYALGYLGLARHTCALVRFLNHMLSIECIREEFTSRERDLMRVAGIMHDSMKSGTDEDFEKSKYTKFDHPLLAADNIRKMEGLSHEEIELVATTIESHMGQWNTDKRSKTILPKPENKYQKLVHLADYLASRKDIEVLFDGTDMKPELPKLEDYVLPFGKHKGEKLIDVSESDKGYITWAKNNMTSEPLKSLLEQL